MRKFNFRRFNQPLMAMGLSVSLLASGVSPALAVANTSIGTNITSSGSVTATSFSGSGSALTALTAANIAAGTAGISVTGNAGTVTNGVYVNGSYVDPSWIASLAGTKITGTVANATNAVNATNAGNAATVTDGVYTSGTYADPAWITSLASSKLSGALPALNGSALMGLTKGQVGLGSVVNADTTTTANITDSLNKRFVTDANLTLLGSALQPGALTGITSIDTIAFVSDDILFNAAGTIRSREANSMTIDSSGSGAVNLGGQSGHAKAINIGTGAGVQTITIGNDASDHFIVNSSGLNVSTAGLITGASGNISQWTNNTGYITSAGNAATATALAANPADCAAGSFATSIDASGTLTCSADGSSLTGVVSVAAAGTLTGTTLAANVVSSSLTSVGTLTGLTMGGNLAMGSHDITGAGSVTATTFNGALNGAASTVTSLSGHNVTELADAASYLTTSTAASTYQPLNVYAMFYGLTAGTGNGGPNDYAAPVAAGAAVPFPRLGPASAGITASTATSFTVAAAGTYEVLFRVHTTEPGQLELAVNDVVRPECTAANMNPTNGGHLIAGDCLVTLSAGDVLGVVNPSGNATALTVTQADGNSTHANAQTLVIKKL